MESDVHRPEEINEKISAMLAATEALKPGAGQLTSPMNSKTPRALTSKVLSKVSSAWDRLNTKSPGFESGHIGSDAATSIQVTSRDTQFTIRSIDIRKNEGINIGKNEKARKLAGIEVSRRPVACSKRSFLNRPRPGSEICSTPSTVESEPFNTSGDRTWKLIARSSGPFGAEPRFDLDLEDRVLSIRPDGSSTPRILIQHRRATRSVDSRIRSGEFGFFLSKHRHSATNYAVNYGEVAKSSTLAVDNESQDEFLNTPQTLPFGHYLKPPTECRRVKKHPSPNKEYLERLKTALEEYTTLKISGAGDRDLDELADMLSYTTHPLTSREKNQLPRRCLTLPLERRPDPKGSMKASPCHLPRGTYRFGSTRSSGVTEHHRIATRSFRTFRPHDDSADDPDELR
ncbi:unnamed protein product [Clonostachys byssicola]|uniref:Uncharacterized protein n=1 Tax=Clonostachys byssicola TaxID=160290 RepID=A0A9N9UU20_9HYPO|nr:unnamed protein product [Clonostachys byssicola]